MRFYSSPSSVLLWLCLVLLGVLSSQAQAEGSRELNNSGGSRVYLEWNPSSFLGGTLARRSRILAYVRAGETINLGSSVVNTAGNQDIVYSSPSGTQAGSCDVLSTGFGLIDTLAKERAGPLPNVGGYTPCTVTATETGIYLFEFRSNSPGTNPTPLAANAEFFGGTQGGGVAAWDVTIRDGAVPFTGRVFTPYLSVNMGNTGQSLSSNVFVLTRDGYQYRVDFNGVDPFGFILVANRTGFTLNGKPTFQSLQLSNNGASIPTGYAVGNEDVEDLSSFHRIFFNPPNPNLPSTAAAPGGSTWLLNPPTLPADIQNVRFTGQDGTPAQFAPGTGGTFAYDALGSGTVQFALDLNNDGIYGNANDRVLFGTAETGPNTIIWDGRDAQGLPATTLLPIQVRAELAAGDVHFPYMDAETNTAGLIIERLTFPDANRFTVYWDDTPLAPVAAGSSTPALATQGVNSAGGAHRYPSNYGDNRGIDTWALYPSGRPVIQQLATPGVADVVVQKTHAPAVFVPGQSVTWTVTIRNDSTLVRANNVPVTDSVPAAITGVTWTCTGSGGATCVAPSGSGNAISTRVSLPPGATATFSITGTLSSTYTAASISNTASAGRGDDTSDPIPGNNSATATAPVDVADIAVVKTGVTAAAPLSNITYTLTFSNTGPSSATVTPRDSFSNSTFVSASDGGTASGTVVTWPAVTLASAQSITRTVTLRLRNNNGTSSNTASFLSDKADPITTNNTSTVNTAVQTSSSTDLVVQKSGPALVRGQTAAFTLLPRNIGSQPSSATTPITVTDVLPGTLTFVSATGNGWTCTVSGQTVSCTSPAIIAAGADGEPITLTVTPTQAAGGTSINNTASISGGGDSVTTNNSHTITLPLSSVADVRVTKTPTSTSANAGSTVIYTLTVINDGPSPAAGIILSDPLPNNVTYVSASNSGSYDAATRTVTWPGFSLNGNTSAIRTVTVVMPVSGTVTNPATISTTTPESNTGNNAASSTLTVTPQANLELTKLGPASFGPSANLTYTLRVVNLGPSVAETITVSDPLPVGTTYVSHTGGGVYDAATRTMTWTVPSLPVSGPGSSLEYTITVLTPTSGTLTNTASVSSATTDPVSSNNTRTVNTTITPVADLVVTKNGPATVLPGGDIIYSIGVLNSGPSQATSVTVTDLLPTGATVTDAGGGTYATGAGGGTLTWILPTLDSGMTQTYTITLQAPTTAATLVNAARASSPVNDPDTSNNDGSNPTAQVSTTVNVSADLRLTKTGPAAVRTGATLSYTLTLSNLGPADAGGSILTDPAVPGFSAGSVSCTASGNALCPAGLTLAALQSGVTVATLPAGGSLTLSLSGTATGGTLPIVNTVTGSLPATRTDPTPINSASATTDTVSLTLSKTVQNISTGEAAGTSSSGRPNDLLEYCLTYQNSGSAPLPNLTLTDPLPITTLAEADSYGPGQGIRFVRGGTTTLATVASGDDAGSLNTVLTYAVGTVASGETGTVCFQAKVR